MLTCILSNPMIHKVELRFHTFKGELSGFGNSGSDFVGVQYIEWTFFDSKKFLSLSLSFYVCNM